MKEEIYQRSKDISNVSYKLAYALLRGGQSFHGRVEMSFTLTAEAAESDRIFCDYRGKEVRELVVNGT